MYIRTVILLIAIQASEVHAQEPLPCGDCDGDRRVTALDSLAAAQHAASVRPLVGITLISCNVQGTAGGPAQLGATVDTLDALVAAQLSVGLIARPGCGGEFALDAGETYWLGVLTLMRSLAVADADNDGDLDVACHKNSVDIYLFINDGDGTITRVVVSHLGLDQFDDMTYWDWDGDGILDLAACRGNLAEIAIFRGDAQLHYTYAHGFPAGVSTHLSRIFAMDLNGDSVLDLASGAGYGATVLLSNGSGSWDSVGPLGDPTLNPWAVGDFDRDGVVDLQTYGQSGIDYLTRWQSSPVMTHVTLDYWPAGIQGAAIDVDGDGNLDVAASNWYSNTLDLLVRNGASLTDVALQQIPVPSVPMCIATGDLNADGNWDIVIAYNGAYQQLSIFLGDGAGQFRYEEHLLPYFDFYSNVRLADMDGDGDPDIVLQGLYLTVVKNLLIR